MTKNEQICVLKPWLFLDQDEMKFLTLQLLNDCYQDYQEECDSDFAPADTVMLSKKEWLKTQDARVFFKIVTERRVKDLAKRGLK